MNRCCIFVLVLFLVAPLASAELVIVDLGNEPPPAMVGPYPMTAADLAEQEKLDEGEPVIFGFSMEVVGNLLFNLPFHPPFPIRRTVPTTWPEWGHGYQGPVFHFEELTGYSMLFRDEATAFYFYARPRGSRATIEVLFEGQSTGPIDLEAEDGPRGFAFYGTDHETFNALGFRLIDGAAGLGIAEFGAANLSSACTIGLIQPGQTVEGQWTDDCRATYDPSLNTQFFSFELEDTTALEIELEAMTGLAELQLFPGRVTSGFAIDRDYSSDPDEPARIVLELEAGTYTIVAGTPRASMPFPRFILRLREIAGVCSFSSGTLCIDDFEDDRRFAVNVDYDSAIAGHSGRAHRSRSEFDRGGIFYFFDEDNPEVMIKVLRGCPVTGHYWIFVSAVTNVGFTVTVRDTITGEIWTYENPDRNVALPVQDLRAFACDEDG
ncbi:MAG: PPC domain-containing protein [Acidobacteriota bacterium]|nr:PPC domain-containing protein [Acidobacteriota bacterium]